MTTKKFARKSRLLSIGTVAELLANNAKIEAGMQGTDLKPEVKLFTPDANATWVIASAELWGSDDLRLWGWCDLGLGMPEFGYVLLSELEALRGNLGLPVEQDRHFFTTDTMQEFSDEALVVLHTDIYD